MGNTPTHLATAAAGTTTARNPAYAPAPTFRGYQSPAAGVPLAAGAYDAAPTAAEGVTPDGAVPAAVMPLRPGELVCAAVLALIVTGAVHFGRRAAK